MRIAKTFAVVSVCFTVTMCCLVRGAHAESATDLVRETLRQQSAAERSGCSGVQRTISSGSDAALVVRTAVELGYNACQVIRCALEGKTVPDKETLCEKVIRGAVAAGVQPDVISRCSTDVCDTDAVAAILAATMLEPNYCYFYPQPLAAPDPLPPAGPVFDRSNPQQISPFGF